MEILTNEVPNVIIYYYFNEDCSKLVSSNKSYSAQPIDTITIKEKLFPTIIKKEYIVTNETTQHNLKCDQDTLQETINSLQDVNGYKIVNITDLKWYYLNKEMTAYVTNSNEKLDVDLFKFLDQYSLIIQYIPNINYPFDFKESEIIRVMRSDSVAYENMNNFCCAIKDEIDNKSIHFISKIHVEKNADIIGKFTKSGMYVTEKGEYKRCAERKNLIHQYETVLNKVDNYTHSN